MKNRIILILASLSICVLFHPSELDVAELSLGADIFLKYTPIESSPPMIVRCSSTGGTKIIYEGKIYERSDSADIFLLKLGVRQPENLKAEEKKRLLDNLYIWYPHILSDDDISLLATGNRKSELFKMTRLLSEIQSRRIDDVKNAANQTALCISLGLLVPFVCYPGTCVDGIFLWISSFVILPMTLVAEGVNLLLTKPVKRFFVNNEIKRKTAALNREIDAIYEEMNSVEKGEARDSILRNKSIDFKKKYYNDEKKYFPVY